MKRVLALVLIFATLASAAQRRHGRTNLGLRKRLHVNPLIVEPGNAEFEWDGLYSFLSDSWSSPAAVRYTPEGPTALWGRTEYSVSYSSPAVQWAATTLLHDGEHLDFAIIPQASFFVRDEKGSRLGGTLVGRYDQGLNSFGSTLSWSGATHTSPTNPAGTFDWGLGYGRQLAASGWRSQLTPHVNTVWERSSSLPHAWSAFEGFEYQITDHLSVDVSGQHLGSPGGPTEHQIVVSVTLGIGHAH